MAKEKWISDRARLLIVEAALEKPEEPRRAALSRAKRKLAEEGERAPEDQTIEKEITNWRKSDRIIKEVRVDTSSPEPASPPALHDLDDPWALGSLSAFDLPGDALGDVLEVRKLCWRKDFTLTIRQAQWVARLRSIMLPVDHPSPAWSPQQRLTDLYGWAYQYALRERTSDALSVSNHTEDLDNSIEAAEETEWHMLDGQYLEQTSRGFSE